MNANILSNTCSVVFEPQRNHIGVFRNQNGKIHYYYVPSGTWAKDNSSFASTPCAGDMSAVFEPQRNHSALFFKGSDGYLHYYYVPSGAWAHDGKAHSKQQDKSQDQLHPYSNHKETTLQSSSKEEMDIYTITTLQTEHGNMMEHHSKQQDKLQETSVLYLNHKETTVQSSSEVVMDIYTIST
eukprot:EC824557.1.p1 GENE.EC824557.1~~EC824557.1.p1  ORF type:complete len:183 (+),score=59.96 EC824557.1:33-581(+)